MSSQCCPQAEQTWVALWDHLQHVQFSAWVVPRGREGGCGYSTHQPALKSQRKTFGFPLPLILGTEEIQGGGQEGAEGPRVPAHLPQHGATAAAAPPGAASACPALLHIFSW